MTLSKVIFFFQLSLVIVAGKEQRVTGRWKIEEKENSGEVTEREEA